MAKARMLVRVFATVLLTLTLAAATAAAGVVADKVLFNGKVLTVDRNFTIAEAVAVKGDRLLAVGTTDEILKLAGPATVRIDLQGRTVMPGLNDTHTHVSGPAESEYFAEVYIPTSVKDLLAYVEKKVKTLQPGEWIYFRNTYPTRLAEYRFPTLAELDRVAPDNPVFVDGAYAGQANSAALRAAGINKDSKQPPVGEVVKDPATGEPTGIFLRCQYLVTNHYPKPPALTHEQRVDAIAQLLRNYNQVGLTSVTEARSSPASIRAFNDLYRQGRLTARLTYVYITNTSQSREKNIAGVNRALAAVETPAQWGKLRYYKIWVDGGILTGTAYMREAYGATGPRAKEVFGHTDPGYKGVLTATVEECVKAAEIAYDLNLQMTAHCIGDAAHDVLFEAYRRVDAKRPIKGRRWSTYHGDFTDYEMMKWMADKGVLCLGQIAWFYKDGDVLSQILTPRAMKSFYPFKTMEELGVVAAGGSDHMVKWDSLESVNPYNPWLAMYAMVTRQTERGGVINPEERISRESALRQYTINGAYATFTEDLKGSLEPGKLADLIVIDRDYLTCPAEEIKDTRVLLTMVDGRVVYTEGSGVVEIR